MNTTTQGTKNAQNIWSLDLVHVKIFILLSRTIRGYLLTSCPVKFYPVTKSFT